MTLVDANLLVYAHVSGDQRHERARIWLDEQLAGTARVGLPWPTTLAFIRLVTNPRIYSAPSTITRAWTQVGRWLDAPVAWIPQPTRRHRDHLQEFMAVGGLRANDVPDAHLAALCREHGLRLATTDTGFSRFPGLPWFDPLIA